MSGRGRFAELSVLVPKALGATLMSTVVVRGLKKMEPNRPINCAGKFVDLFSGSPYVDRVFDISDPDLFRKCLQDREVIDLTGTHQAQPHRRDPAPHLIDLLCGRAGVTNDGLGPECFLRADELVEAERTLSGRRHGSSPVLMIATRTSTRNKEWPLDKWQALIRELGPAVAWIHVGDSERALERVSYLSLSPRQTIALAGRVDGVLTLDTFLLHAAACRGPRQPPAVALLGSSNPKCVAYPNVRALYLPEYECQPCGRPFDAHDVQLLPSGEVAMWRPGKPMKWTCEHVACMDLLDVKTVADVVRANILSKLPVH